MNPKINNKSDSTWEFVPVKPEDEIYIEIYKVLSKCWKCKENIELITYHSQVNHNDNHLGDLPFVDEILLKKYPDFLQRRFSKTQESEDIVNVCKRCNQIQGNFFQRNLWSEILFKDLTPLHLETITLKVSDILSAEDIELFNNEEKEMHEDELREKEKRKRLKNS